MYKVIAKTCTKCGLIKLLDDFCNSHDGKFKKKSQCKVCDKHDEEKRKRRVKSITIEKPCSECGVIKLASEYNKSSKSYDGLTACCKECLHLKQKIYYTTHQDKIIKYRRSRSQLQIEYNHNYYNKNKEEILEKQHEYNIKNKDKILNKHKQYREENPEYMIKYRRDNKEKLLEWAKDYRKRNPDKCKINDAKHREFGFDPVNIYEENFHAHHLWLTDNQDLVVYIPNFLHQLYVHNHNKPETMITINAIALDFMIHQELYHILYYEDDTFDQMAIEALDSGVITFIELSNMMYESRKFTNNSLNEVPELSISEE
jgi:hypothetical protein